MGRVLLLQAQPLQEVRVRRALGFCDFREKPGCADAQMPLLVSFEDLLSWVLNEDVAEPRQGHSELASNCADVCGFSLLLQTLRQRRPAAGQGARPASGGRGADHRA